MSEDAPHPITTTTTSATPQEELKPAKEEGGGGGELEEEGGGVREEVLAAEGSLRGRRKLENADSSYDSDFDPKEDESHGDVCRTVSDTLGAEFAEYVTKYSPHAPTHSSSTSSHSTITPPLVSSTSIATTTSSASPHPQSSVKSTSTTGDATATTSTTTSTAASTTTTTTTAASTTTTATTTTTPDGSTSTTTAKSDVASPTTATTTTSTLPPTPTTTTTTTTTTKDTAPTTTPTSKPPTLTLTQPHLAPKTESESGVGSRTVEGGGQVTNVASPITTTTTVSTTTTTATAPTTTATTTTTLHQRPSYASQVEFGIKLGYSEALVQLALIKLGATPDKDDLLAELIRLGTTNLPRADGGGGGAGGGAGGGTEGEDREEMLLSSSSSSSSSSSIHQHHLHLGQHPHLHHLHLQQDQQQQQQATALRPVIIDGSNVAMSHGNKTTFSCRGLRVCVEWFRARGHGEITVFVPAWRKEAPRWDTPIADQEVLLELERERVLVFTPSRVCGGKRIVSYDDRYILKEAVQSGGVVVSNDNFRDLVSDSPGFRRVVEENLLMYSWVNGRFVPPDDPLGRGGPTLDVFLRRSSLRDKDKQAPCPYGRKCTYGNKCKYKHPERGTAPLKSVTERLQEQVQRHYQNKAKSRDSSPGEGLRGSLSLPVCAAEPDVCKKPLTRTQSIVPTVSLTLPSALTQDTPTHDHSPATTPATSAPSHRYLMPPPLDPLRSATLYKSDSALYHLYPSQPAPGPPGYGSSAWGWEGGQQGGGAGHYGSHLPLGKQQSDPDQQDNPHRKLQRQLTLNPSYDSRLYKIHGFREPAPEHFPLGAASSPAPGTGPAPGQSQGQGSPSRVGRGTEGAVFPQGQGRASPGYSSGPYAGREQVHGGLHPPLARHSSQDGGKHLASLPPHLYPSYSHPHVTRFASAPDPIWGGPHQPAAAATPPLITRLNSTSDTRLNLYAADSHYFTDVYEDPLGRPASYAPMPHPPGPSQGPGPVTPAPGPVGSRPMSPQSTALHHSPSVSPRGHTPPQQQAQGGAPPQGAPAGSFPPPGHEDTRLRVFYHLSQLFPEAQVRAVMTQHPEETDPQKICGSILAAAAQGGSRPMSPQHQTAAPPPQPPASPYLLQAFPGSPLAAPPASHEDARLRAFYHLSQLFPEAEVRAVLARAPDETDIQQFCAALLARRGSQQS